MKRILLLAKNPALSHEAFLGHWTGVHAPLVASTPGYGDYVSWYGGAMPADLPEAALAYGNDGFVEFHLKPTREDLPPLAEVPHYKTKVIPDTPNFCDKENSLSAFAEETVVTEPSGSAKIVNMLRAPEGLSRDAFLQRLVAAANTKVAADDAIRGYRLNVLNIGSPTNFLGQPTAGDRSFDVIEEIYYDTLEAAQEGFAKGAAIPADGTLAGSYVGIIRQFYADAAA